MIGAYKWKHGWADAYAYRNGDIAEEFFDLVVRPTDRPQGKTCVCTLITCV